MKAIKVAGYMVRLEYSIRCVGVIPITFLSLCMCVQVQFLISRCTCPSQFPMVKVSEGKYRVGDSNTLIFVRVYKPLFPLYINFMPVYAGKCWCMLSQEALLSRVSVLLKRQNSQSTAGSICSSILIKTCMCVCVCFCVDFEESCYGASGRRMGHPGALSRQTWSLPLHFSQYAHKHTYNYLQKLASEII